MIIWVSAGDCDPPHGLNLAPGSRDRLKVESLLDAFELDGFDLSEPALIGYPLDGRIQLLSGTHRHRAATLAEIRLPVTLWLRSTVEQCWGRPLWAGIMEDIQVSRLMDYSESLAPPALSLQTTNTCELVTTFCDNPRILV